MAETPVQVAAVQFAAVPAATGANIASAEAGIRQAAAGGARLVVLPECAISGYDLAWFAAGAPGGATHAGGVCERLTALSAELGTVIVANDLERCDAGFYSTSVVYEQGRVICRHRKTVPTEAELAVGLKPGSEPAPVVRLTELPVTVAPMICYEYAFPEIALDLAAAGATVLAISSAIRAGFEYLPAVRVRARAQDNAVYVVAAHAVGPGLCGASMITGPQGDVLARASADSAEVILAAADPRVLKRERGVGSPGRAEHQRVMEVLRRRGRSGLMTPGPL